MRRIAFLFLLFPFALSAQEDCQLFNIQDLAAENLALHDSITQLHDSIAEFSVDTVIFQPDGSFEVQLSNGTTFTQVLGCTDPAYTEYNAAANTDDGSCTSLVVNGCTDPTYTEYNAVANTDDGSCTTLVVNGCTDPAYLQYNASANTDDGSCTTLVVNGCTDPDYTEYDASANVDDGSCTTLAPASTCSEVEMDGYTYSVVEIGDQCWFSENLRSTVYADGTSIPEVTNGWGPGVQYGARCDYENDAGNVATYGRLYNWYAVDDSRGLCPSGWHVPTDGEWTDLEDYITSQGFSGMEGTALKSTSGWFGGGNGTDDFGFSALPGGERSYFFGSFNSAGTHGQWWSSSPGFGGAWYRDLNYYGSAIGRHYAQRSFGWSVRCLRDAE